MSISRLDALAKRLTGTTSRRAALAGTGAGIVALSLRRVAAQEATPVTEESLKLLFGSMRDQVR